MKTDNLVRIDHCCEHYKVEFSFVNSLQEFGLIKIVVIEDAKYLSHEDLKELEKLIRLHYELGINMEGIDVISNLLKQITDLQQELKTTTIRLRRLSAD